MNLAANPEPLKPSGASLDEELLSLRVLVTPLWKRRWLIAMAGLLVALAAGTVAFFLPKKYEAVVVLSAVSEESGASRLGALGALASQFGGLASLVGGGGSDRRNELLAIVQSESLTTEFIRRNDLLPILFADKWDPVRKRWTEADPAKVPTLWKGNQFFKRNVRAFSTETKTGLSTLTITWTDPHLAARWANDLVALANDYVREKAVAESERNIAYLNTQLAKTNVVAVQNSISALLENEIKKVMLAQGSSEYAYRVLDAATVPEKRSSPIIKLWIAVGFFLGLILSSVVVLLRSARDPS